MLNKSKDVATCDVVGFFLLTFVFWCTQSALTPCGYCFLQSMQYLLCSWVISLFFQLLGYLAFNQHGVDLSKELPLLCTLVSRILGTLLLYQTGCHGFIACLMLLVPVQLSVKSTLIVFCNFIVSHAFYIWIGMSVIHVVFFLLFWTLT